MTKRYAIGLGLLVIIVVIGIFIAAWFLQNANKPLLAFPGAAGFGSTTGGGRGGQVITVTNLNDEGSGSLRDALENVTVPRIVVFAVSGNIDLSRDIVITHPFVTVAGQTAPGDGIILRAAGIQVSTHDVVIRGLKIRVGDVLFEQDPNGSDAISLSPLWGDTENPVYNVVIDHNDLAWALDELIDVWHTGDPTITNSVYDVTFSWNFVYEALGADDVVAGNTSTGVLISGNNRNLSLHHNLIANNDDRNPRVIDVENVEVVNNVIYNWGDTPTRLDGTAQVNLVNNVYRVGPNSSTREIKFDDDLVLANSAIHIDGNTVDVDEDRGLNENEVRFPEDDINAVILQSNLGLVNTWYSDNPPIFKREDLAFNPTFIPDSVSDVYTQVMMYAGAQNRDVVSLRLIDDVTQRTGSIISSQTEVGGWHLPNPEYEIPIDSDSDGMPDVWERSRGLNPELDDSAFDRNRDGYTNIEEYINGLIEMP